MKDAFLVIAAVIGGALYASALILWCALLPTIGLLWTIGWLR